MGVLRSEKAQTKQIAYEVYRTRLLQNRSGNEENDWRTAEKIIQSPLRVLLFRSNHNLIKINKLFTEVVKLIAWDIPRWFLFSLPHMEWMKLLAVPLLLGAAGSIITSQIQREANQNAVLKSYFDQLQTLTFQHNLLSESPDAGAILFARGQTVASLRELDLKRKTQLIAFLQASGLVVTPSNRTEDRQN